MKTQARDESVLIRTTPQEKQGFNELAAILSMRTNGALTPDKSSMVRGLVLVALNALKTNSDNGQWLASQMAQCEVK